MKLYQYTESHVQWKGKWAPEKWKVQNSAIKGIRHKVNKSHKSSISQDAKNKSESLATGKWENGIIKYLEPERKIKVKIKEDRRRALE